MPRAEEFHAPSLEPSSPRPGRTTGRATVHYPASLREDSSAFIRYTPGMKMTPKRQATLDAYKAVEKRAKRAPSLSEVALECGVTTSTVHEHAQALFTAGLIHRTQYGGTSQNPYFKYHAAKRCAMCGKKL